MTDAPLTTTTEVYPDSEKATAEECNKAQVESSPQLLDCPGGRLLGAAGGLGGGMLTVCRLLKQGTSASWMPSVPVVENQRKIVFRGA